MPYKDREKQKAHRRKYYLEHQEESSAYGKLRREANSEEYKEYGKKWREANPQYMREWRRENLEICAAEKKEWRKNNKERDTENTKAWRMANPKKDYEYKLKRKYGLSTEEWQAMFDKQRGRCLVCGTHQSELKGKLHVDHDHETGMVRGLLCSSCNVGIGYFKNDTSLLERAIAYLDEAHRLAIDKEYIKHAGQ